LDKRSRRRSRSQHPPADVGESIFGTAKSVDLAPGNVDIISHEAIAGWAWNPLDPEESVLIDIYDGSEALIRVRANGFRGDLRDAGIGTGNYGFLIPNPKGLLPFARHHIAVKRAADGVDLPGSPRWLLRPEAGFDLSLTQFLESAVSSSISVAQSPTDLDQQITITLRVLNRLLNSKRALTEHGPSSADPRLQGVPHEAEVTDWNRERLSKVAAEFPRLHFEEIDNPLVSIVIPVYNKFRTTYNCLKAISENKSRSTFEIIIVDDSSRDETVFAGVVFSGAVEFARNENNQGFVNSCNTGAARARGKLLVFLNNDTLVRANWLDELVSTFDNAPNVGIVGSKLLFADGSLQESGGIVWRLGDGWNWGRHADPNDPRFCYLRDCDYVSGAALMIERELFEQLAGFDERYAPAYYEDADLCFRVRASGKRVVVQPASEVVHLEGVSAGVDVLGSGMKRFQLINQRKFYERWKESLLAHRFTGEEPDLEAERVDRKRAYFIDNTMLTPEEDAGSNAALQHILALMRLGYKVIFLPADNMAQLKPHTINLQKLGVECLYAPYFWSVEEVFRKARVKPDLVYFHRFLNASKYTSLVRHHFPDCFTVYNVADLHFLRQERELAMTGSVMSGPRVTAESELAAMRQVDSVIVHSSVEADILRQRVPDVRVHTVPWTVLSRPSTTPFKDRFGYAFIGGYNHKPNVDAAMYLVREIAPLLKERDPEVLGYIVGSNAPPEVVSLESRNIKFLGFTPDLTVLLHGLRCTVAPLRYGAGLKGKILESFAHGLPCVMTDVAAEGLSLPRDLEWLIARTPQEFAKKLVAVHDDESLNSKLSTYALDYIAKNFSAAVTQRSLAEAIATGETMSNFAAT
jgi:O-antigen biosynthesis protein